MGLRPLADLLKSLRESRADQAGHPAAPVVARVCRAIMKQVALLGDEQLEKEGLEVWCGERKTDEYPAVHATLILALLMLSLWTAFTIPGCSGIGGGSGRHVVA